jgi:hypothetical protein
MFRRQNIAYPLVLQNRLSVIHAQFYLFNFIYFKGWLCTYLKQVLLNLSRIYRAMCCICKYVIKILALEPILFLLVHFMVFLILQCVIRVVISRKRCIPNQVQKHPQYMHITLMAVATLCKCKRTK